MVRVGIGGVEHHGHTWEFGARKAKDCPGQAKRAQNSVRIAVPACVSDISLVVTHGSWGQRCQNQVRWPYD
jgi:hypothetical protein